MNIRDIAKIANVSVSTVSKILNNKDNAISLETRKKVLEVVKEYQYVPYSKIHKNKMVKTHTIGLVLPSTLRGKDELVNEVIRNASGYGYSVIVSFISEQEDSERKELMKLSGKNVEGVLLYSKSVEESIAFLQKAKMPFVLLNNTNEQRDSINIYYDYEQAGYIATKHLILNSHTSIGCLILDQALSKKIEQGYNKALYENDILFNSNLVFHANSEKEAGQIGIEQLLKSNITAVLCENSEIVAYAYHSLRKRGIQIPNDMSIISAEKSMMDEVIYPAVTSIKLPRQELAQEATKAIIGVIEEKSKTHFSSKGINVSLFKGESVAQSIKKRRSKRKIIVVGSMNMDAIISVPELPRDGETLISSEMAFVPGGKGANQAVGVAKLEGIVYAIGRLGNDSDGMEIYNNLERNLVRTDGITFDGSHPTGKAFINVSKNGKSTIVVYPGANSQLSQAQLEQNQHLFEDAAYCLLSMEIPEETVECVISLCKKNNVKVILKPSVKDQMNETLYADIDIFVPNEKELNILVPGYGTIEDKAKYLHEQGITNVVVTLGEKGCFLKNENFEMYFRALSVEPVDTTGAADAFISALAVYLNEGNDIKSAIQFAICSAGISVTRHAVQPALPDRITVNLHFNKIK